MRCAFLIIVMLIAGSGCAHGADYDYEKMLPVIKSCADIGSYDSESYDINELMLRVLYTHENFKILTNTPMITAKSGNIYMCNTEFIKDAVYKAFRLDAPTPEAPMLTTLGYCENNGYYYFTGGYREYFATDVKDIIKVTPLGDGSVYVFFSNTYQSGESVPEREYNGMHLGYDSNGYYALSLDMGGDFSDYEALMSPQASDKPNISDTLYDYLPLIVAFFTLAACLVTMYLLILRR